ncbi:TolB family protein [Pseudoalteromonas byunsanensis]|uniref:Peptidase MA-like domain-containing protein n=1 Tax=Pseudoalteromonas byunsanensis TaxID=327939 RepID=A0A1S1NDJ4_9GAMM|nr:PD40 domain-containing protein [Pseudoalteromonas byunsanensis]OHU97564.1 hypothetical protein BIW53_01905 [Pseudoalteromonas byunsanensis]
MRLQWVFVNLIRFVGLVIASVWMTLASAAPAWYTIQTEHFNIHYTQGHQLWAISAAKELEIVRDKVWQQQSRGLSKKADVVIFDPIHAANGFALPSTDNPLMALFTTPPQSDTAIANHNSWQQLLILHEYIHLVHLSQPSRHTWKQALRNVWDLYDVSQAMMPRWVAEGYATLVESKMTGRGRLYDNYSEALLRELAQQGALLSYEQLNDGNHEYQSKAMAYLLGARFLAWLEQRYSQQTLDSVWTRMRAVTSRDFTRAFKGVFAEHPATLYRRFIAEYTYQAMEKEQQEPVMASTLWQEYAYGASSPVLSADGSRLAIVEHDKEGRVKLNVYQTQDDPDAERKFMDKQRTLLNEDPQDVAEVRPKVFAKKTLYSLEPINFSGIRYPQWLDNNTLYFIASTADQANPKQRRGELFRWSVISNKVEQLTQNQAIRRFTLVEDGQTIYAEQVAYGYSELVKIHLPSQQVTALFDKQISTLYDFPSYSAAQQKLAFLKHTINADWQLYIQDVNARNTYPVPLPKGYQYLTQPSWSPDGDALYFVAGKNGALDIYRYELSTGALYQLTQGQALFQFPIAHKYGQLLYLSSGFEGVDMYQLSALQGELVNELEPRAQSGSVNGVNGEKAPNSYATVLPPARVHQDDMLSQRYDIWHQDASLTLGAQYASASTALINVGLKGSDFLEQLSWHIGHTQDVSRGQLQGNFAKLRYQYDQFQLDIHGFDFEVTNETSTSSDKVGEEQHGMFAQLSQHYQWGQLNLQTQFAGLFGKQAQRQQSVSQRWLRVGIKQSWLYDQQSFAIGQKLSGYWLEGQTAERNWQGQSLSASLFGKAFYIPMALSYQYAKRENQALQLGGFSSSLMSETRLANIIMAPELPFYTAQGNKYEGFSGAITLKESYPWLYFQQHQLDGQLFAQSYGIKWSVGFNGQTWLGKFSPAGLSDFKVDVGMSRVEGDSFENENRAWFGLWYDL